MPHLTAWLFPTPHGADAAEYTLKGLEDEGVVTVHDAAVVSWPEDAKRPTTRQLKHESRSGAMRGSFWGLLFGTLFLVPVLGAAVGAAVGAMSRNKADTSIDGEFIKRVRERVTPGTSALFVLTDDAVVVRVREAFADQRAEPITTKFEDE